MAAEIYSLEFKKKIVREYELGHGGYKKLARLYNLTRDTVRNWVLNPRLHESNSIPAKEILERDLDYYQASAAYWEEYAHRLEEQLADS